MAFWGPEKMVMGSDYPHQIGDLENCVGCVKSLQIEGASKEMILGGNAAGLLKL